MFRRSRFRGGRSLFLGRFQPFHKGHLEALRRIIFESDDVILLVGSAQFHDTKENPFSISERKRMIRSAISGLPGRKKVKIYQVDDIFDDSKYVRLVERVVPRFDRLYYGRGYTKKLFRKAGYAVVDLPRYKRISASRIRQRIIRDKDWEELVPEEVAQILKKINGIERIKAFY